MGRDYIGRYSDELVRDPGVRILQKLVWEFRAGMIAAAERVRTFLSSNQV